jgi:hypothetical protein
MAKERRELRQAQANQLIDNMPKDLNRPWEDPIPEAGERLFTQVRTSVILGYRVSRIRSIRYFLGFGGAVTQCLTTVLCFVC